MASGNHRLKCEVFNPGLELGIKSTVNGLVGGSSYYNNITEHKAVNDFICMGNGRGNQKYYDFKNGPLDAHSHDNYMRMLDG